MNPVVHFQMPYDDAARASRFYQTAFGWEMKSLGEQMGNYVTADTTESDRTGPLKPGNMTSIKIRLGVDLRPWAMPSSAFLALSLLRLSSSSPRTDALRRELSVVGSRLSGRKTADYADYLQF